MQSAQRSGAASGWLVPLRTLPQVDLMLLALVVASWLVMFVPTYVRLASTTWATDEQGHGPIILAVSFWLLYRKLDQLRAVSARPSNFMGGSLLIAGLLAYIVGRAQSIGLLEVGAQIPVLAALMLLFRGWPGLRLALFPLFFLIFMVPLPSDLVAYATGPLKAAVSAVASSIMHAVGYPIGRAGVLLSVGPYQLLVADACAGMNSMFTLEALGLLYLNILNHTSMARNVVLAIAIIPISFSANVVRVITLVLITYHFGDEAGQGFLHGFSGMVLFMVALMLIIAFDSTVGRYFGKRAKRE